MTDHEHHPPLTPTPWGDNVKPTTRELRDWLMQQTDDAQLWLLDGLRVEAEVGMDCFLRNHDNRIASLDARCGALSRKLDRVTVAVDARGDRYRLAWMSARRRAQQTRNREHLWLHREDWTDQPL